jgi:TPR repeat protein
LKVGDITYIAIPLSRVPVFHGTRNRPTASQNSIIAGRLLLACSAAKDSLATLQILAAVYHSGNPGIAKAGDIARLFSVAEINRTKAVMEQLAEEGDTEAMTLHGKFLEKAGKHGTARYWYEKATENCKTKFDPRYPHPMAFPRETPWMALVNNLMSQKSPETLEQAKAALQKGAFKASDPLAYYQLASLEDGMTPDWFTYVSKAAASGHLEATYKLGHYYMNVNTDPSSFLSNSRMKRALKFVTDWEPGSIKLLAKEWFAVAAAGGHKPAMLELSQISKSEGDEEGATHWLRCILEPPPIRRTEEWPKLVEQTRRRLGGL